MGNYIACPNCNKTIANQSIIEDAAKGEGSHTQSIVCDCGEKLSYWKVTALLREQKTISRRFQNWVHSVTHKDNRAH
jgi:hypothetical protein